MFTFPLSPTSRPPSPHPARSPEGLQAGREQRRSLSKVIGVTIQFIAIYTLKYSLSLLFTSNLLYYLLFTPFALPTTPRPPTLSAPPWGCGQGVSNEGL